MSEDSFLLVVEPVLFRSFLTIDTLSRWEVANLTWRHLACARGERRVVRCSLWSLPLVRDASILILGVLGLGVQGGRDSLGTAKRSIVVMDWTGGCFQRVDFDSLLGVLLETKLVVLKSSKTRLLRWCWCVILRSMTLLGERAIHGRS